jgi:hypothetical protein
VHRADATCLVGADLHWVGCRNKAKVHQTDATISGARNVRKQSVAKKLQCIGQMQLLE